MPWRLINNNLEIDTGFITCAEYQLFIDEIGGQSYPFHWQNARFPAGTAKKPITGVKADDALAFCLWLTEQHSMLGYKYRLPTLSEAKKYLTQESKIGYWCSSQDKLMITGISHQQWQIWQSNFRNLLELSGTLDLVDALIFLLESISDIDINLILVLDRASLNSRSPGYTSTRARARSHGIMRVRELVRSLGHDVVSELTTVNQLANQLKKEVIFDHNQVFEQLRQLASQIERNLVFESDLVLDLDLVRDIDLGQKGELITELDFAHYLASKREKLLLQTRNYARLLTLDLAGQLTKCLMAIQINLEQTAQRTLNLDFGQIKKLTHELDHALAVIRPYNQPQYREIESTLSCISYFVDKFNQSTLRYRLLLITACWHWLSQLDHHQGNIPLKNVKKLQQEYAKKRDELLELYTSLILLEQRQTGKMPAWEGIRLVRAKI